jgi:ABC-2 type transport system permease protein
MKALVMVEIRRLMARRLLRWITALVLVGFTFAGIMAYIGSDDSPAAVAEAQARYKTEVANCISGFETGGELPPEGRDPESFCRDEVWVEDPRFDYSEFNWIISSLGIPLIALGWLVGASFLGAEWHSRSITTLLTWEPRRNRVLVAKAIAATAVIFAWIVLLQVIFSAAMYPAAAFEGTTQGLTASWWTSLGGLIVRAGGLAAFAGVVGMSITAVGRNTAAALGVGFAYLAVVESLIRGFKPQWADWLIGDNVALFLVGPEDVTHMSHSQLGAGLLLLVYGAVLFAGALAVFRRREVA